MALNRLLATLLFGITSHDPLAFVAAPVVVAVIALLASVAPLKRALQVAASTVLRSE